MKLARRHQPLAVKIMGKYLIPCQRFGLPLDLQGDSLFAIWEAARTFENDRECLFSSYVARMARFVCLKRPRRSEESPIVRGVEDIMETMAQIPAPDDVLAELDGKEDGTELRALCAEYKNPRVRRVIEMRYFQGDLKTFAAIADELNTSHQAAQQMHSKFLVWARKRLAN